MGNDHHNSVLLLLSSYLCTLIVASAQLTDTSAPLPPLTPSTGSLCDSSLLARLPLGSFNLLGCSLPSNATDYVALGTEPIGGAIDPQYINEIEKQYLLASPFQDFQDQCQNHYDASSDISSADIQQAIREAIPRLYAYIAADEQVRQTTPGGQAASRMLANLSFESQFFTLITQSLMRSRCTSRYETTIKMPTIHLKGGLYRSQINKYAVYSCKGGHDEGDGDMINCDAFSKYPTYDGSCNNLRRPTQGMSFSCHRRLLPPDYGDGISALRVASDGATLPNARLISNELLPDIDEQDLTLTQLNMQWGQFVVHDLVRTPITMANVPECCPPSPRNHPECEVIAPFPPGDILTEIFNQTCARNTRTNPCPRCKLGPRQQTNAAPHAMDLSNVYGYSYAMNLPLRTFENGKLRMGRDVTGGHIMPTNLQDTPDPLGVQSCNVPPMFPEFRCFTTGDGIRGNQHPALTALQTLILRRHNMHAQALSSVNPHWNDDTLFWEARRLTTAEYQHISFSEYLPSLFSNDILHYFNLKPLKFGYTKYEPDTDHSTIHEWATAAGRFGHSQINHNFVIKNEHEQIPFRMKDVFFEMSLIHLGQTDGIIKGLSSEPAFEVDPFFSVDVKNFLYQLPNRTTGLDLMSINVLRGRDHGLPGYINYLDYCFGYKVSHWSDLYEYIPSKQVENFQRIYRDVKDVDLFVGGVSERRLPGNAMGPTFACINGVQWYHTKFGNRFYYEHGEEAGSFTPEQLANIRETTTAAHLICRTTKLRSVSKNVFQMPDHNNPEVECGHVPEIDYRLWQDEHYVKK